MRIPAKDLHGSKPLTSSDTISHITENYLPR